MNLHRLFAGNGTKMELVYRALRGPSHEKFMSAAFRTRFQLLPDEFCNLLGTAHPHLNFGAELQ